MSTEMKLLEVTIIINTIRMLLNGTNTDEEKIKIIRMLLEEKT